MYISETDKVSPEAFDQIYRSREGKPDILLSKELRSRIEVCDKDINTLFSLFRLESSKDEKLG